jgi:hypothetical protein
MRNWLIIATLTAAWAVPSQASTVLAVDFQQLSRMARHVVSGTVTGVKAEEDPNGYIYSNVTIQVRRAAPAHLQGREYTFRMLGGETSSKRLLIQGMPRFQVGDKVALFLNNKPAEVFGPTVGLWQGVFYVETDPTTGQEVMLNADGQPILSVRENRLVRGQPLPKGGLRARVLAGGDGPAPLSADRFFDEVRVRRGE